MDNELWDESQENFGNTEILNEAIDIYFHKIRNKNTTVIDGLIFKETKDKKTFITSIKKKFGITGYETKIDSINSEKDVIVFSGNIKDKIKTELIKTYGKNEDNITVHGF